MTGVQAGWERRRQQGDELLQMVSNLVVQNDMRCFTNDILLQLEEKMMEEVEMEDKTREELKEEIVREKNSSVLPRRPAQRTHVRARSQTRVPHHVGLVPKHVCLVM